MPALIRIVGHLPVPKGHKLLWRKHLIYRAYRKDIRAAQLAKDQERAESLKHDQWFEIDMIEEEEQQLFSSRLVRHANQIRVPSPSSHTDDGKPTGYWEEGRYLGLWFLTDKGIAKLREDIRTEMRWRYERWAHRVAWLSAITGVLGALTGLVATLHQD